MKNIIGLSWKERFLIGVAVNIISWGTVLAFYLILAAILGAYVALGVTTGLKI